MPHKDPAKQKAAWDAWYEKNKEHHKAKARASNKANRTLIRQLVHDAKSKPCEDCKVQYPYYVMQFDHVRGEKLFTIGEMIRGYTPVKKLQDEIAKCDVVCANCHAERTWQRKYGLVSGEAHTLAK